MKHCHSIEANNLFCGTRMFITVFTKTHNFFPFRSVPVQFSSVQSCSCKTPWSLRDLSVYILRHLWDNPFITFVFFAALFHWRRHICFIQAQRYVCLLHRIFVVFQFTVLKTAFLILVYMKNITKTCSKVSYWIQLVWLFIILTQSFN